MSADSDEQLPSENPDFAKHFSTKITLSAIPGTAQYPSLLRTGCYFVRYTNSGKPRRSYICCTEDLSLVCWGKNRQDALKSFWGFHTGRIRSRSILDVKSGRHSKAFKKSDQGFEQSVEQDGSSFSLFCQQRTVDIEIIPGALSLQTLRSLLQLPKEEFNPTDDPDLLQVAPRVYEPDPKDIRDVWIAAFKWLMEEITKSEISAPYDVSVVTHVGLSMNWKCDDINKDFMVKEELGSGTWGTVYRAIHKKAGFECAVKQVKFDETVSPRHCQNVRREIEILKECSHENLVQCFGCAGPDKNKRLWILMDICDGGNLCKIVRTPYRFSELQIRFIIASILRGLHYLHSRRIGHLDIKAANVLLQSPGIPKLGDFGVAKHLPAWQSFVRQCSLVTGNKDDESIVEKAPSEKTQPVGTPLWMAPEVILGNKPSNKADVWSLGIVAYELATGYPPHMHERGLTLRRLLRKIVYGPSPKLPGKGAFSKDFHEFLSLCTEKDPRARPHVKQLMECSFVNNSQVKEMLDATYDPHLNILVDVVDKFRPKGLPKVTPINTRPNIDIDKLHPLDNPPVLPTKDKGHLLHIPSQLRNKYSRMRSSSDPEIRSGKVEKLPPTLIESKNTLLVPPTISRGELSRRMSNVK